MSKEIDQIVECSLCNGKNIVLILEGGKASVAGIDKNNPIEAAVGKELVEWGVAIVGVLIRS